MADTSKPWIEKYRPKTIDDVAAQEHTVKVLRKQLGNANVCFLFKLLYTFLCFYLKIINFLILIKIFTLIVRTRILVLKL